MIKTNYLYKNNRLILKIMRQNIKNNSKRVIDAKLYTGKYYDFMLFKGNIKKYGKQYIDSLSIVDFSTLNIKNGILYSDTVWNNAINDGVELFNVGFTGMDNGLISFRKDRITNEEFLNLYLNSHLNIESGDTRLFLSPVTGNTLEYNYPIDINEEEKYISCKGGFYQGFFKLHGHKYQVLPNKLDSDWFLHFELKPRSDYNINEKLVNFSHPDNEGIFFFLGTRAENKFWPFYKTNSQITKNFQKLNAKTEGYFLEGLKNDIIHRENKWLLKENGNNYIEDEIDTNYSYFAIDGEYFSFNEKEIIKTPLKKSDNFIILNEKSYFNTSETSLNTYDFNSYGACWGDEKNDIEIDIDNKKCEEYFIDGYFDNKCPEIDNGKAFEDDYIGEGILINTNGYEDSEGHKPNEWGYTEIESDNKFLMFDRTPSGFTINNWKEGTKVTLTRRQRWPNANYFLLMNRTETGYTTDTIEKYNEENSYDYNLYKDIRNNVFALRITKEGAIGYRYGISNCEKENKYELVEEYSKDGIIKNDEWNTINVRCTRTFNNKMKILFYVNGYLIFISKELPLFDFKNIDDVQEKQECVPYNISLGGGTLGLLETILPNYYAISDYILPIERDFCGTFMGDIKSFKMYEGFIDYSSILNYLS